MGLAGTGARTGMAAALAGLAAALAAVPAAAEQDLFRIGMVARDGEPAVEGLSVIKRAFSGALGMPVEVFVARDYAALVEAQAGDRLDYAIYSATAYAAASIRCGCVRPVAAPVAANGSTGLRSVLIMRPGTQAPAIALGPGDSLTTRLAPLASWPAAAAAAAEGRLVETSSAGAAEAMFVEGSVDGFFGWIPAWPDDAQDAGNAGERAGGSLARLQLAGLGADDYEIGWRSAPLRYGPHAVRADMPQERVARLARLLSSAAQDDPELAFHLGWLHGGGFSEAAQDDYAAAIEALAALDDGGE